MASGVEAVYNIHSVLAHGETFALWQGFERNNDNCPDTTRSQRADMAASSRRRRPVSSGTSRRVYSAHAGYIGGAHAHLCLSGAGPVVRDSPAWRTGPGARTSRMEQIPADKVPTVPRRLIASDVFGVNELAARRVRLEAVARPVRPGRKPRFQVKAT